MHCPLRERVDDMGPWPPIQGARGNAQTRAAILSPRPALGGLRVAGNVRELQRARPSMGMSDRGHPGLPHAIQRSAQAADVESGPVLSGSLDEALEEWERRMILDALSQTQGVQARAAKILGISERSLWYRIKKLGIQVRTPEDGPPPA